MVFLFIPTQPLVSHHLKLSLLWNASGTWVERRIEILALNSDHHTDLFLLSYLHLNCQILLDKDCLRNVFPVACVWSSSTRISPNTSSVYNLSAATTAKSYTPTTLRLCLVYFLEASSKIWSKYIDHESDLRRMALNSSSVGSASNSCA